MQMISFIIIAVALVAFQTTVLRAVSSWLGAPDLVFILVSFVAYRFALLKGLGLVFILGWMMDVVSGIYLGTYLLQYLLYFMLLHTLATNSSIKASAYQVPLVGVSYFVIQFVLYFVLSLMVEDGLPLWSWSRVLRETILLTVATIPCFLLLNSCNEFILKRGSVRRSRRKPAGNTFR